MTPARKAALQWFHDRPDQPPNIPGAPSLNMIARMIAAREVDERENYFSTRKSSKFHLTDLGRRRLHGDDV